jgi:anaerobic selenocysteine-containing dehydrogenase
MKPLGQSRPETEIYMDLCEKMGKLYGEKGYIDQINQALSLKEQFRLPLDRKPTVEQVLDAWARSKHNIRLEELQVKGVVSNKVKADKLYMSAGAKPFNGVRAAFYVEAFLAVGQEMRKRGVAEEMWSRFTPYPVWTEQPMEASPADYDLDLMDCKRIEHKHTRTATNPLLRELRPDNPLVMNAHTAHERGLKDGDPVWVESHNPSTGETRQVRTNLATVEGIRPDTVLLTHHVSRPEDPSANGLLSFGPGFWDIGGGWFSHIKVKVRKAEAGGNGRA